MRTECAYEVAAVIFLAVIAVSYKKKNWLDLYMNRCFDQLLRAGLLFTFLDVAVRVLREYIFPGFSTGMRSVDTVLFLRASGASK